MVIVTLVLWFAVLRTLFFLPGIYCLQQMISWDTLAILTTLAIDVVVVIHLGHKEVTMRA